MITEEHILYIMKTLGFDRLQAIRHLRCRINLGYALPRV